MYPDTRPGYTQLCGDMLVAGVREHNASTALCLRLFGYPQVTLGDRPLHFARRASLALLAYLAMDRRAHRRDTLAALLGDRLADGQRRLRSTLADLDKQLGDYLVITPQTVTLNPRCPIVIDSTQLEHAFGQARAGGSLATLREAVEQCRYEFLEGFVVSASQGFEEWQACERERLHTLLIEALAWLCHKARSAGDLAAAMTCARRLVALEPWHEGAHRSIMLLLVALGQPAAALAQYEECRQILDEELGIAPGPETQTIYERLRTPSPPRHNLAPESTAFIGRRRELARLIACLDAPTQRLVVISGQGGMGKTRLALRVAACYAGNEPRVYWGRFPDGAWLIPLDTLETRPDEDAATSAERIYATIAAALGLGLAPGSFAERPLLAYLRERQLLLVLDNLEHLPGADLAIRRILAATNHVTLLATTRLRCGVDAAQTIELGPMDLPSDGAHIDHSDAGALFLSQARQKIMGFAPTPGDRSAIVRICAATGGLPLAIVLAAHQLRMASCAEIADRLVGGGILDLATNLRNLAPRHRSLRANLAYGEQLHAGARWLLALPVAEPMRSPAVARSGIA